MIHQELNLMDYMTVAENIWIRREPLNALGFVRHDEMRRRTKALFERLDIGIDPETEVRDLSVANRQMVEIAKAVSYDSDILIMDEPTSALTDREVEHLFKIIRTLKAQGKGIVYITHKMNELFEIADEVSVFRDGHFVGEHAAADVTRDEIIHLMVGREITQMFPKETVPIGDVALSVKNLSLEGRFRDISFDLRKGEILGFAGLVGSGRSNVAETLFGVTPATSGTIAIDGKEIAIRNPGVAMDAGMAFLTEDRKESGCFLLLDVMANMQIALLRHGHAVAGFVKEREIEALCQQQKQRLRVRTPDLEEPVAQSLRRQPAEGSDRPLADDEAAHSHPRRADPRHRRRRQGRDSQAHLRARRTGRGGDDDLVGNARGARHERPDSGHARGTHDRHRRPQGRNPGEDHGARVAIAAGAKHKGTDTSGHRHLDRRSDQRSQSAGRRRLPPELSILGVMIGMMLLFEVLGWIFVGQSFIANPLRLKIMILQEAEIGIIAVGVTQVIIMGGIDLSSGSVVGMTAMIAASLAQTAGFTHAIYPSLTGLNPIFPVAAGLVCGLIVGLDQRLADRLHENPAVHRDARHDGVGARRRRLVHNGQPIGNL